MDLYDDFLPVAVEGANAAEGTAAFAGSDATDPEWQPI